MRCINKQFAKFFIFFGVLVFARSVGATSVLPFTPEQLVERAPLVVYGKVVQIQVDPFSGRRTAVFEAIEVAKSPEEFKKQRDFLIPLLNRSIPHRNLVEWVSGAPEMSLDQELVVFLRPIDPDREGADRRNDGRRIFALEGFHQAKLRVFWDSQGVRRLATWSDAPEKALTPNELKAQKSTSRSLLNKTSPDSESLRKALEGDERRFRSLDSLLNAARTAGAHS